MKSLFAFCSLGLLLSSELRAEMAPAITSTSRIAPDSIGVELRDGKRFILHRVNQGQTLYALARRYNTSVDVIKAANPDLSDAIQYNQVVRIPQAEPVLSRREERAAEREARRQAKAARKAAEEREETASKELRKAESGRSSDLHIVETGQTLYSLAVRYKVAMADLRRWNNLSSDTIQVGQTLIVSEKGYAIRHPATNDTATRPEAEPKPTDAKPDVVRKEDASRKEAPKPDPAFRPDPAAKPDRSEDRPIRPGDPGNNMPAKGRRIAEIGMAERIETDESANKYLALHRSAPVGSLVHVRNDISNQSMWVKVIGRLPNTGVNERVLIKLSAGAFSKLSPNNQSFRAEVSYLVP